MSCCAPGDRRVPAGGQPDVAAAVAQALHRELPVGAGAGHPLPRVRSRDRRARPHRHQCGLLRLPPRERLRARRRAGRRPRRLRRRLGDRRRSTCTASRTRTSRSRAARCAASGSRWSAPEATSSARCSASTAIELPSTDYARMNTRARAALRLRGGPARRAGLLRPAGQDRRRQRGARTWHEPDCYPGEGVFVGPSGSHSRGRRCRALGRPGCGAWHLVPAGPRRATFTEVARAELPHPVLFGYHGQFFEEL